MKKYISTFALSIFLCSQSFAGFDEIEKDIQNEPARAVLTCQKLSDLNKNLSKTDSDPVYLNMSRCYKQIASYLIKLTLDNFSALGNLSSTIEELQSFEAYLRMIEKPIPSLSQPNLGQQPAFQLAAVPAPKAQAGAAAIVLPPMKLDQPLGSLQSKEAFLVGSESLGAADLPKYPAAAPSSMGFAGSAFSSFSQGSSGKSFGRSAAASLKTIAWENLSEGQKQVSDLMWKTISTFSQKFEGTRRATIMTPSLLFNPTEFLTWIEGTKEELKLLGSTDPTTIEIGKANYDKLEKYKESIYGIFNSREIKVLEDMHTQIRRIPPEQEDPQLVTASLYQRIGYETQRSSNRLFESLKQIFFRGSQAGMWDFRESMFPGLMRPIDDAQKATAASDKLGETGQEAASALETEKAAPAAAAQALPKVKISDTLDADVKGAIGTLNETIQSNLKKAWGNEAIMKLGSNEVARPLLQTIEANLDVLRRHFNLPKTKPMTVDEFSEWHKDLVKKFSKILPFGLRVLNIKGNFKNLSDHFSDPYQYVDNRVPHLEYLKAFTFSKTVYEVFGKDTDMSGLVLGALSAFEEQGMNCGAGAFGRSILLYNSIFQFMMDLEK